MQSVKNGFAPPFSLCFSKSRAARQSPFCKAVARPFQSRRKALPKSTKTGRKSVGFLILTQAPKCTRSHCFPPQKHPKNGFMMRFAGKNSFFQLRARDFSFYMNAYICHSSHFSETRDYLWRWIRRASSCFSGLEGLLHSFHVSDVPTFLVAVIVIRHTYKELTPLFGQSDTKRGKQ